MSEQTEELHRAARCVYIAMDKPVADDLARILKAAADHIALLEKVAEAVVPCMNFDTDKGIQMVSNDLKAVLGQTLRAAGYLKEKGNE